MVGLIQDVVEKMRVLFLTQTEQEDERFGVNACKTIVRNVLNLGAGLCNSKEVCWD